MEVNAINLNALFLGFDTIFNRGFEKPASFYADICTVTRGVGTQTLYPFMGRTTQFSEWLDKRHYQNLKRHGYAITNKDFENTVEIDRNDIEDDLYGTFAMNIEQMGSDAKVHPDELVFGMIKNAMAHIDAPTNADAVVGYDEKTFFSVTGHPVGLDGQTITNVPNVDSGGTGAYWFLLDCSRAIRPFIFQIRQEYKVTHMVAETDEVVFDSRKFRYGIDARVAAGVGLWQLAYASNQDMSNPVNYASAVAALKGIKTDAGKPFGTLNSRAGIKLLVPSSLEGVARQLLNSEFVVGMGGSSGVTTSNAWKNSADLIVSTYL